MEPQDDILTEDQYIQLEKFLMGESKDFRLPDLSDSKRTQANNPAALQHGQSGEDATRTVNNGIRTMRQWCNSSVDDDGPLGFSDFMAQRRSNGSVLASGTSYVVRAPDAIQPVQWSSPAQTTSVVAVQPANNTGSPKPSSPSTSTLLADQYNNNPTQPQVNNTASSAATQLTNLPPTTFNTSNLPQAPINNNNNVLHPSNNVQQAWSSSEGHQRDLNPQPQVIPIDDHNAGSSIASRFAAASQGVSLSNPRAYSSQYEYDPLGFVAFARPNVTDLFSQQHCAFVNGVQMDGGAGYGAQASLIPPQVAAAKGGQDTPILPMYSSSTFRDLAVMAQRNNNLARQKQQESPAVRNPRGRPRGPRKRQPPPQWAEEAEYELEHARNKQPYNVRRAQWQNMKLPGRAPMSSSPRTMSLDGGQAGWGRPDYSRMNFSNHEINQGQNGNLPLGGNQNLSRVENMPAEVAVQFGINASSEVLPAVATSQGNNVTLYGDALSSGVLLADENPNKFWSFGSNNPPSTMPSLPSQNNANNNETKGKKPIEDHINLLQSGTTEISEVPVRADADQIGGMPNSFPNSGDYESMIIEPAAEAGIQFWNNGHMQSTYIDFENACVGLATTQEEAPAVSAQANNNISSCDKQSTGIVAETNNNLSMNLTSFPMPTESHVSDQFIPISVTDYLVDYEPMQLTDEDLIACALTEPFQTPQATNNDAQPNDKPAATIISHSIQTGAEQPTTQEATYNPQPMEEQVITQQTKQAGTFSPANPVQCGVAERAVIAEPTAQAATFCPDQNVQNGVERQVPTLGDFQTNNSSQQLAQQANSTQSECNISSNNDQQPSMAPQPAFRNSSAQFAVQDGSSSVHQTYTQNSTFDGNNIPAAHQGSSSQVPCNPTAHWATRSSRRLPRNLGPTAYYYYQQQLLQQQQQGNSANGQRHYTMPPPPVQQQTYPYGRPYRAARRRRQNTQFARNSAMNFSQCAITPSMFNDMIHDGSVDSILGSELWPGLHQDVFNTMVMADASLLDPIRLQERIAQLNSGMLPLPNLLHSMRMNQHQAGSSAPAPDRMTNYGPPPETQPNPTFQQGLGVADGANNYNFTDPQMLMNENNIPNFQNQQQQNLQSQMNANMQQVQPNLGNWSEYPAPSSSRLSEEIQQPVPANTSSTVLTFNQENVSHIPPQQHAAPPPNPQTSTNPAYNPMFGVPYARRGPHM